jgi:hypothetical protein
MASQGTGLGLSTLICRNAWGKLWLESEEEKGSTFYFTLPYQPENELENVVDKDNWSEKLSSVVNSNVCRLKILAAEDEKYREG